MLVSPNAICFRYLCQLAVVPIKRLLQFLSHFPSPGQVFARFVCSFTRNTLSTFSCSDLTNYCKNNAFQSKTNIFFQLFAGRFWDCCFMYMCFLGRFFKFFVCIYAGLPIWSLIKSYCITKKFMPMVWKLQAVFIFWGNYNLVHNILELYNVLIQTRLTTNKTKRDI